MQQSTATSKWVPVGIPCSLGMINYAVRTSITAGYPLVRTELGFTVAGLGGRMMKGTGMPLDHGISPLRLFTSPGTNRGEGDVVYASVVQAFSNEIEPFALKGSFVPHDQRRYCTLPRRMLEGTALPRLNVVEIEKLIHRDAGSLLGLS